MNNKIQYVLNSAQQVIQIRIDVLINVIMLSQETLVKKFVTNQMYITHNNNNNVQIFVITKIISIK